MNRRELIAAVLILILLAILGYFVLSGGNAGVPAAVLPQTQQYTNSTYGYSIEYPAQDTVQDDYPAYVTIGTSTNGIFNGIAEIDVVSSDPSILYTSFDDFAQAQASLDCDASGPGENITCPSLQMSQPFSTVSGLAGEEFYLTEFTSRVSGASATSTFGPFFAFDISGNVPQQGAQYDVLLIRPLLSSTSTDSATIEAIANSLQIQTAQ